MKTLSCLHVSFTMMALLLAMSSFGKLSAQEDPFTVNNGTTPPTLTLINAPAANYTNPAVGSTYYSDGNTYTITLTPGAALNIGSTGGPVFTVGDGTTNNTSDFNTLTTNGSLTMSYNGGTPDSTININGIVVGTNGGNITNLSFGTALQVTGTLGLNSANAFTNNGLIAGTVGNAITATTIGYLVNSSTGVINGGIGSQASGTILYLYNAGHINADGALAAIQADSITTLTNTGFISGGSEGIYITGNAGSSGTITNFGNITGTKYGIEDLGSTGTIAAIINESTGNISGASGISANQVISDVENYGKITGTAAGNGIGAQGGTGITVLNNYAGATISGFHGVNANELGTVNNSGTIQGFGGDGITTQYIGSLTNTGTGIIEGQEGIRVTGVIASLTNSGTITGNGAAFFSGIDAGAIQSFTMTGGSVTGSLFGIKSEDGATLVISGGTISGGTDAIMLNDASATVTSTITINGGANIQGLMMENTGTGSISLNLVGLSPTQKQELQSLVGSSSGTFDGPAGDVYAFQNLTLQGTTSGGGSTLVDSVDNGLKPLAATIDTNGLPSGPQYNSVIAAIAVNPETALQSLSGREITGGFQDIKINLNNSVISQFDNQLDNLINAPVAGGIDFGSLSIGSNQMIAYNNTTSQLKGLLGVATMSDVAGTEMGIPPERSDMYRWGVWGCGTVSFANESQRGAQSGYNALSGTPTIGISYRIDPSLTVGALANYTTAGANFGDGSKIDLTSELFGVFAEWDQGPWRVHGLAAGGISQYDNQRVTLDNSTASSSPDGTDVLTDATGGYEFKLGDGFKITPQLGVQYTHVHKDATNETGSDLGLNVGSQDIDSLRSHLGFILTRNFQIADKLQFIPEFRAAWYHEYMDGNSGVNTSLQSAPALGSFAVTSVESPQRDYALLGVGLNTAFTGYHDVPVGLFINYDVQAGQASYIQQNVSAGIRVAF